MEHDHFLRLNEILKEFAIWWESLLLKKKEFASPFLEKLQDLYKNIQNDASKSQIITYLQDFAKQYLMYGFVLEEDDFSTCSLCLSQLKQLLEEKHIPSAYSTLFFSLFDEKMKNRFLAEKYPDDWEIYIDPKSPISDFSDHWTRIVLEGKNE